MKKDYKMWTKVKVSINNSLPRPIGVKIRQIWYCSMGENIGFEEDGKGVKFVRPVLILKTYGTHMCHIVPLSTTQKRSGPFYYPFNGRTGKISVALLSQSRVVDSARLYRKIGIASKDDFEKIKTKFRELFG